MASAADTDFSPQLGKKKTTKVARLNYLYFIKKNNFFTSYAKYVSV